MRVNVVVPDKTVTINGEGYLCTDLFPPEEWAHAYHWDDVEGLGNIEPNYRLGRDNEYFTDPVRIRFAIDSFNRAKQAYLAELDRLKIPRPPGVA